MVYLLCSDCFNDLGLRRTAEAIGSKIPKVCRQCGSRTGKKLNLAKLEHVLTEFFWNGTYWRTEFGGANRLASNEYRYGQHEVRFAPWVADDARLIEEALKIGIFHYGPQLWRIGEVVPLIDLRSDATRGEAAKAIVARFPTVTVDASFEFYRMRLGIDDDRQMSVAEYDSPPDQFLGNGRLDSLRLPILYGSRDVEACFHECRVTIPDECFVARLRPAMELKLLNFCAEIDDDAPTPFDSINVAMMYIFSAEAHSYPISRSLAEAAYNVGVDGIVYPSYFSLLRTAQSENVALFGRPIKERKLELLGINRMYLTGARYEFRFGPIFDQSIDEE